MRQKGSDVERPAMPQKRQILHERDNLPKDTINLSVQLTRQCFERDDRWKWSVSFTISRLYLEVIGGAGSKRFHDVLCLVAEQTIHEPIAIAFRAIGRVRYEIPCNTEIGQFSQMIVKILWTEENSLRGNNSVNFLENRFFLA